MKAKDYNDEDCQDDHQHPAQSELVKQNTQQNIHGAKHVHKKKKRQLQQPKRNWKEYLLIEPGNTIVKIWD